jgi:oligopeptide transport system substrate-binding protein
MLPLGGTLDPVSLLPADSGGRDVVEALFAGLTRYDPASNQAQPGLAREWTVSADGLTWTFKLRNDVQWVAFNAGSGKVEATRPLVAGDFLFALRRACDAEPPNPVAHTVYIVAGCRSIAQANPLLINDVYIARELGVRAVNAQTLEIKLVFPAPYLPVLLALPEFRAVPREAISRDPDWTRPGLVLTSGPYALAARDAQTMTLVRNPFWPLWEEGKTGNVERIVVAFSPSPEGLPGQFTAGNVDFARLDSITAGLLRQAKPDALLTAPGPTVTVLGFSVERTVIRADAFRRALALALDRESLVRQALPARHPTGG